MKLKKYSDEIYAVVLNRRQFASSSPNTFWEFKKLDDAKSKLIDLAGDYEIDDDQLYVDCEDYTLSIVSSSDFTDDEIDFEEVKEMYFKLKKENASQVSDRRIVLVKPE